MQLPHAAGFYQELGIFRAREFCIVVAQEASSMPFPNWLSDILFRCSFTGLWSFERRDHDLMRKPGSDCDWCACLFSSHGSNQGWVPLEKKKKTIHAAIAFRWRWKCSVDVRGWQILFPTRRRLESRFSTSCFLFCDVLFNCYYEVSANNCHCLRDQTLCLTMLLNIGIN